MIIREICVLKIINISNSKCLFQCRARRAAEDQRRFGLKERGQLGQGIGPVAEGVFGVGTKFGETLGETVGDE